MAHGIYKRYDRIKQIIKPLIPQTVFRRTINGFHLLESVMASIRYGFPARSMRFVGVTGTNGKTTTCLLIASILETAGHNVGVNSTAVLKVADKSWDNDLALTTANPWELQKLLADMKKANCDWVVMEVASHSLIQHRVWGIHFEAAVMTNLTRDHLDYHGTMQDYAAAKGKLFSKQPKVIVLNRDDDWYEFFDKFEAETKLSYGTDPDADARITEAKMSLKGTRLAIKLAEYKLHIKLQLPGQFNAYNAAAAAATAYGLGINTEKIKEGLEKVDNIPGRMQTIEEGQDFTVIIDHAHTPDALENLFKAVRMLMKGRLISVMGADGDRDPGKRETIGQIAADNSQAVIVTDQEPYTEDPEPIRKAVLKGVEAVEHGVINFEIPDRREAIRKALSFAKEGDVVLIPGLGNQLTRGMKDGKMPWDDREVARELLRERT